MKFQSTLLVLTLGFSAFLWPSSCEAQWRLLNQPSQKSTRWMGQGWSGGYHWRNPGHDSRYYNPYSHHNSFLRSQSEHGIPSGDLQGTKIYVRPGSVMIPHSQTSNAADALVDEYHADEVAQDSQNANANGAQPKIDIPSIDQTILSGDK